MPQLTTVLKEENEKMATLQTIGKPGDILQTFIDWTVRAISFVYETDRYKELVERQQAIPLMAPAQSSSLATETNKTNKGLQGIGSYLHRRRSSAESTVREMAEIKTVADSSTDYAEKRAKARSAAQDKTSMHKTIDLGKQNTPAISS
jgi:hypothetical protein